MKDKQDSLFNIWNSARFSICRTIQ